MNDAINTKTNIKHIVAAFKYDKKATKAIWRRIGTAFQNKDGSWNLRFDLFPTDPAATIQLRDPHESNQH
jgi:hypothetical protein